MTLGYLFVRLEEILADLGLTLRVVLHPRATRRRLIEMQKLAHRRELGNRTLAKRNAELARERDEARAQLDAADIANRNLIRNNEALARLANLALNALPKPPAALDEAWADVAAVSGPEAGQ